MKKINVCEICCSDNIKKIGENKYTCYNCGYVFGETHLLKIVMPTLDEWIEKYKPLKDKNGNLILFDTYGGEIQYVKNQIENNVWTFQEGEEDNTFSIIHGLFRFNSLGYFITEIPYNQNNETEKELFFVIWVDEDEILKKVQG